MKIGKVYDSPRPCPDCGYEKAIFRTTAACYGAWWKCDKCGRVYGTYEWPHNKKPEILPKLFVIGESPFPITDYSKCNKCKYEFELK